MKPNRSNPLLAAVVSASVLASAGNLHAVNLYWDGNGDTAGAGTTPTGIWGTDLFWNTTENGDVTTPTNVATTGLDDLFFSAGADAINPYTITVNGSQNARLLTFEDGTATLSGGTSITLGGGGGITVGTSTVTGAIISTALTINGNNTFNVGAGRTLTLDSGAFTRGTRATLNIQGAGTVTTTKSGLAIGGLVNGIIGPWASFGVGASTQYATIDGSNNITGLTGTAAATATDVTSTLGTFNYDVAAVGTLGTGASINTLRYTGAAGTIAGGLTTKGIMNTGGGTLVFSGAVTSGLAATELVVNTANGGITFDGVLTGTIVKTGSGTMTMGNVANVSANLPNMTVNEGILITNTSTNDALGGVTINSGGTLRWGAGGRHANNAAFTINAGGTLDVQNFNDLIGSVNGAGNITGTTGMLQLQGGTSVLSGVISGSGTRLQLNRDGAANVTLSGLSSYGGTTTIQRGTLNINSIGNVNGAASAIGTPTSTSNGTIAMGADIHTGTLVYTGGAAETNRVINLAGANGGATLTQSGTGLLKFTSAFTSSVSGSKTLTLSGSTAGTGELAGAIVNNGTTGSTALAVAYTLAAPTSTIRLGSVNGITVGAGISGTGIQGGTTITAIDTSTNVVTLSLPTNAAGTVGQTMTVAGVINITSLAKSGSGIWTLSGANTYTGATTITDGTLRLSGAAGKLGSTGASTGSYAGAISIGNGATFENASTGSQTLTGAISGGGTLSHASSGQTFLQTATNSFGALTVGNASGRVFINTFASLPSAATVSVTDGNLVFAAGATYNNAISVGDGGALTARNASVLSNVTLPGAGTVIFQNDDATTSTLSIGGTQTLTGSLTVQIGGARTNANALGAVTLSGQLTGSGPLVVTNTGNVAGAAFGTGSLILSNSTNDYTGGTTLNRGTLGLGADGTLGATSGALAVNNTNDVAAGNAVVLNLATAADTTVGSLSGAISTPTSGTNTATINTQTGRNFTVNQTANGTYEGAIAGGGDFTLGSLSTQTLTLTGNNTHTGTTTITAGTLAISGGGTIANTPRIQINSSTTFDVSGVTSTFTLGADQTLTGGGTVLATGKTVNVAGTLAPGASPGTLTQDGGAMQLAVGGDYNWQIHDASGVAGTGYDTTNLINDATLDLSLLSAGNTFNINLWSLSAISPADVNGNAINFNNALAYSWTLFSTGEVINGFSTDKFTINTGAFNDTNGFTNDLGGGAFNIGLADGGTDLVLNFTPVPEPRAALLGGLGLLALLRRRRD